MDKKGFPLPTENPRANLLQPPQQQKKRGRLVLPHKPTLNLLVKGFDFIDAHVEDFLSNPDAMMGPTRLCPAQTITSGEVKSIVEVRCSYYWR